MTAIDRKLLGDWSRCRDLLEKPLPDAPLRPAVITIIDCGRRPVSRWNIPPPAPRLQHMQDARDHRPVIYPRFTGITARKVRFDRIPCFIRKPEKMP